MSSQLGMQGTQHEMEGSGRLAQLLRPADEAEAVERIRTAREEHRSLLPCGSRSRIARHRPQLEPQSWLALDRFDRLLELDAEDLTCRVQVGLSPSDLNAALSEHRLELGVAAACADSGSLGGLFLAPDHSWLHARYGPPRDQVLGARWILADAQIVNTGAKVVKSVAGYDVTRLFLGSGGRLAVATELTLRLHPQPRDLKAYTLPLERMLAWWQAPPRQRPPWRLALGVPGTDAVLVQTEGFTPEPSWSCESCSLEESRDLEERVAASFGTRAARIHLPRGTEASYTRWRGLADDDSAFDFLSATGSLPRLDASTQSELHQDPTLRLLPTRDESPWLSAIANACAPGSAPFGEVPR